MTTYRVKPPDKALVDAGGAYFWIKEQSDEVALRWHEGLLKAFWSLEKNPLCCPLTAESMFFKEEIQPTQLWEVSATFYRRRRKGVCA